MVLVLSKARAGVVSKTCHVAERGRGIWSEKSTRLVRPAAEGEDTALSIFLRKRGPEQAPYLPARSGVRRSPNPEGMPQ